MNTRTRKTHQLHDAIRRQRAGGFTLVEILIVVALVAILAIIALAAINPTSQRYKLYDVKRKRDLNNLKSVYELFHSVNLRYPTGDEICYDDPVQESGVCTCHICGLERDLGTFGQLVQILYCDPQHPKSDYVYQYSCSDTPLEYKLYAHLSIDDKEQRPTDDVSCRYGVTNRPYEFLEPYSDSCGGLQGATGSGSGGGGSSEGGGGSGPPASPTPTPPTCPADPVPKYCRLGGICNICGSFTNCQNSASCDQPAVLFSNSVCTMTCSGQ